MRMIYEKLRKVLLNEGIVVEFDSTHRLLKDNKRYGINLKKIMELNMLDNM